MSDMRIEIRAAEAADSVGVARVQVETWRDAFVGILPDGVLLDMDEMGAAIRWSRMIGAPGPAERFSVALHEGSVVGFCHGGTAREGLDHALHGFGPGVAERLAGGVAEIYALYVEPNYQGLGLGRALLGDVTRHMVKHGCDALGAVTLTGNRHGRRFYEALGGVAGEDMPSVVAGAPVDQTGYLWVDIEFLVRALETVEG